MEKAGKVAEFPISASPEFLLNIVRFKFQSLMCPNFWTQKKTKWGKLGQNSIALRDWIITTRVNGCAVVYSGQKKSNHWQPTQPGV
jgi:hypothetical protein